jgi:hypothetical protein
LASYREAKLGQERRSSSWNCLSPSDGPPRGDKGGRSGSPAAFCSGTERAPVSVSGVGPSEAAAARNLASCSTRSEDTTD